MHGTASDRRPPAANVADPAGQVHQICLWLSKLMVLPKKAIMRCAGGVPGVEGVQQSAPTVARAPPQHATAPAHTSQGSWDAGSAGAAPGSAQDVFQSGSIGAGGGPGAGMQPAGSEASSVDSAPSSDFSIPASPYPCYSQVCCYSRAGIVCCISGCVEWGISKAGARQRFLGQTHEKWPFGVHE